MENVLLDNLLEDSKFANTDTHGPAGDRPAAPPPSERHVVAAPRLHFVHVIENLVVNVRTRTL